MSRHSRSLLAESLNIRRGRHIPKIHTTMNAIIKKIYGAMLQPKIKCGMQSRVVSVIPMRATATSQTNQ